jgi:hypothetical protein
LGGEAEARGIWKEGEAEERAAREVLDHVAARRREAVAVLREEQRQRASDRAQMSGVMHQGIDQLSR